MGSSFHFSAPLRLGGSFTDRERNKSVMTACRLTVAVDKTHLAA
jgi:hypothetical protein